MNKKLIYSILSSLVIPLVGFAANDVTLDPNTEISVSGYTLKVIGDARIVDSLVVGDSSFTVTLSPGANFEVSSADQRKLAYTVGTGISAYSACSSASSLSFIASSANTAAADVVITPSTTETCGGVVTSTPATGGGGGGGSGATNNPNALFSLPATTVATPVQLPVQASPVAVAATSGVTTGHVFATSLKLGSKGTEVTELQKVLVAKGYLTMPYGVAFGTYGTLTQNAVKKFQADNGIDQLGNVGPATRAKLNASVVSSATQMSSAQIQVLQIQLQSLQAQLLILLGQQLELLKAKQ